MDTLAVFFVVAVIVLAVYLLVRHNNRPATPNLTASRPRFTGKPSIYNSYGSVTRPSVVEGSTDYVGAVQGTLTGSGLFEMIVNFSGPMASTPKAVMLSLALPADGMPSSSYTAFVDNLTTAGFEVIGTSPGAQAAGVLFYYTVL